ncbi:MAG: DUF503 domain-containing protein [Deltaproteobacteria bacterium]|nr:DUF503 domain-containing protein [Deltaproteobacteria bacterium]
MVVGCLELTLSIPASSLKEKRSVVRSLLERSKNRFNVSAAETEQNDDPRRAKLGFVSVANDGPFVNSVLDKLLAFAEDDLIGRAEVIDSRLEILHV